MLYIHAFYIWKWSCTVVSHVYECYISFVCCAHVLCLQSRLCILVSSLLHSCRFNGCVTYVCYISCVCVQRVCRAVSRVCYANLPTATLHFAGSPSPLSLFIVARHMQVVVRRTEGDKHQNYFAKVKVVMFYNLCR